MSIFSDPLETAQQVNNARLNPIDPESYQAKWYEGIGTGAVKGVGEVGNDVAMFAADWLTPSLRAAAKPIDEHFKTNVDEWLVNEQRKTHEAAKALAPDPRTTGMVGQLVQGFTNIVPEFVAGTAATGGNPYGGAATVYALQANKANNRAIGEGVDPTTAFMQGQIEGLAAGAGALIPGHLAPALTKSLSPVARYTANMAFGGASQAATGAATRASVSALLEARGYKEMAQQYKAFDTAPLATDLALGVLFGAWGTRYSGSLPEALRHEAVKPSDLDTAMTANNAAHVELGTAPGIPTDVATQNAHVAEIQRAIQALVSGEEFTASEAVTNGNFMENPGAAETRAAIGEAVREHLGDMPHLQDELAARGLPDQSLYSISNRIYTEPIYVGSELGKMAARAAKEGWPTDRLIQEIEGLKERVDLRSANNADKRSGDRVRGYLRATEVLTNAERMGHLSPEEVGLAKWLLDKNPNIANDLAISLVKPNGLVGGEYKPLQRLAVIMKGQGDPLTTAHEFLHHGERMMPEDVRKEIQKAWFDEVKRVQRSAEASGSTNLQLFINDVIKANMGISGADARLRDMVRDGLVSNDAYALVNPSEFWAVNASKLVRERANEGWVQKAVQWVKELVEKLKDVFGIKSDASVIRGLDALLKADGQLTGEQFTQNAPLFNVTESRPKRVEDILRKSAESENRTGVVVGGRPGEMGWSFASEDGTPPPIQHPVSRGPRLEKIGEQVRSILQASGFQKLAKEITGATKLKVSPIEGTWLGNPEPSFVIHGEGLNEESAGRLARLMGLAFSQDATVVTKHSPDLKEGVPTLYIGNGKVLSKSQLDVIIKAAKERGVDLSTSADQKAIKFMHFGEEADLPAFFQAVKEIAGAGEMPEPVFVRTQGELYEAADYLSGQSGADGEGHGLLGSESQRSDLLGRVFDHLVVPYAKAVASEGYRFSAQRYAERFGLTDAERDVLTEKLSPKEGLSRSTVPLMTGEETLDVQPTTDRGIDKKTGLQKLASNVTDVMWALQNRAARLGQIEPGDYSPKAMKTLAQAIADEVIYHVKHASKSAIGWYDAALKEAKANYVKIFPEIATDKDKEMLFDAVLGITSQGNDVHSNSVFAARVFQLVKDGQMSLTDATKTLTGTFGNQTRAIELNLLKLEHLLDTNGYDKMRQLFNKTMTVGEWNAKLRQDPSLYGPDNKPLSVDGAAAQKVTGWMVFGPKIGSFINNLHGDYSTLTADLWFSRTWNRLLGYMFQHAPELEAKQYQEFKDALLAEVNQSTDAKTQNGKPVMKNGKPVPWENGRDVVNMSREELDQVLTDPKMMLELAKQLEEKYSKGYDFEGNKGSGGYSTKSDLRRRAKNWIESRDLTVAAPRSDLERSFQQDTVEMAQKLIKKREGIHVDVADIQAALWFHEKELFGKMGASDKRSEPADYADAAHAALEAYSTGQLFYVKSKDEYIGGDNGKYLGLTIPTEGGEMVPALKALENADVEITKAQQDSQGFGAAVACALRG